jgi:multiple sugar transport system permease protein
MFKGSRRVTGYFVRNPHIKYIAPAMGVMVLLSIIPTVFLMLISLTNYQLGWNFSRAKFTGLENFIRLFSGTDHDFWHSVWISLGFMLAAAGIEMLLGFFIASLLNNTEFRLKPLIVGIMIIPLAMTPSIAADS